MRSVAAKGVKIVQTHLKYGLGHIAMEFLINQYGHEGMTVQEGQLAVVLTSPGMDASVSMENTLVPGGSAQPVVFTLAQQSKILELVLNNGFSVRDCRSSA